MCSMIPEQGKLKADPRYRIDGRGSSSVGQTAWRAGTDSTTHCITISENDRFKCKSFKIPTSNNMVISLRRHQKQLTEDK